MKLFDPSGPFVKYGTKVFNILFANVVIAFIFGVAINTWAYAIETSNLIILTLSFLIVLFILGISMVGIFKLAYFGIAPNYNFGPTYFLMPFKELKWKWRVLLFGPFLNIFVMASSLYALILILTGILDLPVIMIPLYALLFIESIIISIYSLPLMAHTEMTFIIVFKYALNLAHKHIFVTIASFTITAVTTFLIYLYWPLIFIIPSIAIASISYLVITYVFPKYDFEQFGLDTETYTKKKE